MSKQNRTLTVQRLFKAPRETMFDLWTNQDHIKHWWGPNGFTNTITEMDVRPGGEWHLVMHGPDGTDYKNRSIFVEVVRPERLVIDHVSGPKYQMTVTFTEQEGGTLVSISSVFESAEQLEQVVKVFKADEGLKQNMDKLGIYEERFAAEPFVIERTYNAPANVVWSAISKRDEMAKWYFDLAEFRPEVGFEFQFTGGPDGRTYVHLCKVTEVVPGRKLTYSWRYEGYEGLSFVSWELFAEGDQTRLKLTHRGLLTFPAGNEDFARGNFAMGWNAIVGESLKKYLES